MEPGGMTNADSGPSDAEKARILAADQMAMSLLETMDRLQVVYAGLPRHMHILAIASLIEGKTTDQASAAMVAAVVTQQLWTLRHETMP